MEVEVAAEAEVEVAVTPPPLPSPHHHHLHHPKQQQTTHTTETHMDQLPNEIIIHILSFLSPESLVRTMDSGLAYLNLCT